MPDYSRAKIYKIVVKNDPTAKIYIGSTVKTLKARLKKHIYDYHYPKTKSFCMTKQMFDIYGDNNCEIQLIEEYPCKTRQDLLKRETHHITQIGFDKLFNKCKSFSTEEELKQYMIDYYNKHLDTIKEYKTQYHINNYAEISQKRSQKIQCECGAFVSKRNISSHKRKSKPHQQWLATQTQRQQQQPLPKPKLFLKPTFNITLNITNLNINK